ncbi:phage tail protein [Clostridium perfringens]|uniref:phage tail protein n=1 Tax=Clostridium perfringens TaxID=1502 RepID=UPI0024BCB082|nr:phage tail protein [Clostridium perfringens]
MLYIFDRHEVLLEIITDYSEFDFKDKLQTSSIFSFSTSKKNNIKKGNKVGFFRKEKFQLFLIDDFTEHTYIDESQISVVAISDYNILGNSIIEDKRVINGTLREAAEKALEGSEYKVGVVEEFENKNINFYFVSRLKALNDIINTFNCEIDVRIEIDDSTGKIINKYIDFKHRLGKDTGLRFTFDTNLEVIEKSPIGDHFNVLYGRGKSLETDSGGYSRRLDFSEVNNGKKYVEDLESIKKYGRLEGIYENNNIDDKELLLSKTLEKLEETKNPKFIYKVSLRNLIAFDKFEHYQCEKGDTIFILDEEDDLVLEARVVEISEEDNEVILTLSNIETGLMDEDIESEIGNIKDKIDIIENKKPTIDTIYPDTLPDVPILTAKALYASVILDWTYSNKDYYTYELFASQIKNFNPTSDNRIFEGKASSFLHEVRPSQTWYYRARAKNTYGNTTLFSNQIEVTTRKISDSAEIFEEAAIGHAIIKDLDMDKATVGKLKGQRIDARNLTVTDGNEKETLSIDSYGNVNLNVKTLKIRNENVATEVEIDSKLTEFEQNYDDFKFFIEQRANVQNIVRNGDFKGGTLHWWGDQTEEWFYWDVYHNYESYDFAGRSVLSMKNTHWFGTEKRTYSSKCYEVQPHTDYTLNLHYCVEKNIQECRVYVILSNTIEGTYEKVYTALTAYGGQQSRLFDDIPHTFKFNTLGYKYVWISFNNLGIKNGANWQEHNWFMVSDVALYKGDIGAVKFIPNSNELYSNTVKIDVDQIGCEFENGGYNKVSRTGNRWYAPGMEYPYHFLSHHEAVSITTDGTDNYTIRDVKLPARFDYVNTNEISVTASLKGWYKYLNQIFSVESISVSTSGVYRNSNGTYARIAAKGHIRRSNDFGSEGLQVNATLHVTA